MILGPKSSPRHHGVLADATVAEPPVAVPTWLRKATLDAQTATGQGIEDLSFMAGAAMFALDSVVRRRERWAGVWRQRLALAAAAVTARHAGRTEDEAALRDAVMLTQSGDDVGPAGRLLLAWRGLATRPAAQLLAKESLASMLEEFGHAREDEAVSDLASDLRQLGIGAATLEMLIGAFTAADRYGYGRAVGSWLADALLAQRLGWSHAVPLLGTEMQLGGGAARTRRANAAIASTRAELESDRGKSLLAAQARAAVRAIDLSVDLGRRAERLMAIAPQLRAKASDAVVARLLSDDALAGSGPIAGITDRGLRRIFDRLVELGAVRELTGRPTFRVYGL